MLNYMNTNTTALLPLVPGDISRPSSLQKMFTVQGLKAKITLGLKASIIQALRANIT